MPRLFMLGVLELVVASFLVTIGMKLARRYVATRPDRSNKTALYLCLTQFSFCFNAVASAHAHFSRGMPILELMALAALPVAHYTLLKFARQVFSIETREHKHLPELVGIVNASLVAIVIGLSMVNDEADPVLSMIGLSIMGASFMPAFYVFFQLLVNGMRIAATTRQDPVGRAGLRLIAIYGGLLVVMYLLVTIDQVLELGGVSDFRVAAWITCVFAVSCGYMGFTMPSWLRRVMRERTNNRAMPPVEMHE